MQLKNKLYTKIIEENHSRNIEGEGINYLIQLIDIKYSSQNYLTLINWKM